MTQPTEYSHIFKPYFEQFEQSLQKMIKSTTFAQLEKFRNEIQDNLQNLFKTMMAFYERQHLENLKYLQENKIQFEKLSENSLSKAQHRFEASFKKSQEAMNKQVINLKNLSQLKPYAFSTQTLESTHEFLNAQSRIWQDWFQAQKEDIQDNMQTFEIEAKRMLKHSETLRKDLLNTFQELNKQFQDIFEQKQEELSPKKKSKPR